MYIVPKRLNTPSFTFHLLIGLPFNFFCRPTTHYGEIPMRSAQWERHVQVGYEEIVIFDQFLALFRKRYNTGNSNSGTSTETRTGSIKWCHFQWPCMTPNPDFKGMPLSDIDYLRNGTRDKIPQRILHKLVGTVHRCLQGKAPQYLVKDAVSECTWTLSALEALRNALYKFKTYLLTYNGMIIGTYVLHISVISKGWVNE